ncbi:inositol monophosphatase family protein [Desertibaculum subflavum]|uniref:inositol monophosphatase family protein n=1 Tax=Desertibaculum subflavum TaxID=2268458 RepID=UPI000E675909
MALRSALLNVMVMAARKAARGLARDFGEVEQLQVSRKGPADFVSAADHRVEKLLVTELRKARPDWSFRLEEGGDIEGRDPSHRWVIDPLDGTTNFLHGVPHFAISIGVEREGEPVCGVILDPVKDELFLAEKGGGAFLNDRRLRVSARSKLPDALIATGLPFNGKEGHDLSARELAVMMPEIAGIRRMGAASLDLAYVAAGRYDGFWERGLKPWDVCAGIVLVREAGGVVTGIQGTGDPVGGGSILAANDSLHGALKTLLAKA